MQILLLLLVFPLFPLLPQTDSVERTTAESVLNRHIEAKGGRENLLKVKNFRMAGVVILRGEIVAEFEIYQAENRHLSIDKYPDGSIRSHGTDGKIAWKMDRNKKPIILRGQSARDYIRHNSTVHESLRWKSQFKVIKYAGEKTIDGTRLNHLIFLDADKRQINRYFSVESGLFVREEVMIGENPIRLLVSTMSDYQIGAHDTQVPRSRVNEVDGAYKIEFRIDEIEANQLDVDTVFQLPDAIAELQAKQE